MQLFKDKKPCVMAGLAAALTLGATLAAAPATALADQLDAPAPAAATQGQPSTVVEKDGPVPADAVVAEQEVAPVVSSAVLPTEPAQTTEATVETSEPQVEVEGSAADVTTDDAVETPEATEPVETPEVTEPAETPEVVETTEDVDAVEVDEAAETTEVADDEPVSSIERVPDADVAVEDEPVSSVDPVLPESGPAVAPESEDAVEVEDAEADAEEDADAEAEEAGEVELEATHKNQWVSDGNGSYRWYDENGNVQSGWLVTDVATNNSKGGLQRYWLGETGSAVMGLFEAIIDGVSSWFFGTDGGYVARGLWTDPSTGYVYLADNEGRLAAPGWVVSDAYGQGLQRYYVDSDAHAAVPGFSEDGWAHYTTSKGYVLRGATTESDGTMRYADNDGKVQESGWLVTDAFGQGLQRYWVEDFEVAKDKLVDAAQAGWAAYATSKGYVVRGAVTLSDGSMRYADNDGRLQESGWLVTDGFGQGLQRYWLRAFQVVKDAIISAREAGWEAYATKQGYVLRGSAKYGDGVLLADNDGRLESGTGWLVTDAYGDGLQRYYLTRSKDGAYSYAATGFFQATLDKYRDAWFYGDADHGFVVRGKTSTGSGMLLSNNEGVLAESLPGVHKGFASINLFDGAYQVYYFAEVGGHLYAKTGVFSVGSEKYFGRPDQGYIVRGKTLYGGGMIIASSDGALYFQDKSGFVVTDEVDGALQRYYIVSLGDGVMGARIGLFKVGSDQYYGREDQGYVVRGSYTTPAGMTIYGDEDGKISYAFLTSAGWAAWDRVKAYPGGMYSLTQYLLTVDTTNNRVVVFQGTYIPSLKWYGNWTPLYDWACSTGSKIYHDGQGTPTGIYRIGGNADYNWDASGNYTPGGYRTTYWAKNDVTYFTGFILNLGFHSTIGYEGGYSDPSQLGKHITHGCIRLTEENAKWIYNNATQGTKVYVF